MRLVLLRHSVAVYDDVLDERELAEVWAFVRGDKYHELALGVGGWAWRLTDGTPKWNDARYLSDRPWGSPLDVVADRMERAISEHPEIVGLRGESWVDAAFTTSIYQRGVRISPHIDGGDLGDGFAGACLLYVHPTWRPAWSGELLVHDESDERPTDVGLPEFGRRYFPWSGLGLFIAPKPGRMVVMGNQAWHSTVRVDPDAGDNVRCAINAFFMPPGDPRARSGGSTRSKGVARPRARGAAPSARRRGRKD